MALQITEQKGTFQLQGSLNATTSMSFKNHFDFIIDHVKELTLDIDQLELIDSTGLTVLKSLMSKAVKLNHKLYIIGYGCKEIYDDFRSSLAA